MNHHLETSLTNGYAVRLDTPWQRLPLTGPLAILVWLIAIGMLSSFMHGTPRSVKQPLPIDARIIELPQPQPPPAAMARSEPQSPPLAIKQQAHPVAHPMPSEPQPADSTALQDVPPSPAAPDQPSTSGVASVQPISMPRSGARPGVAVRTGRIGVIERPHHQSTYNEEATLDPDGMGLRTGGWHQEYSYMRDGSFEGWEGTFDSIHFGQPSEPVCYNAAPMTPWDPGTCKDDFNKGIAAYKRADYAKALSIFKDLADHDYEPAQSDLASMYADGIGVPKDEQQAIYWWRKAGKNGDAKAVYNMALMYSDGKGVAKDDKEAAFWYRKAAYYGYAEAQYNLGVLYALGSGVPKDDKQAAFWYYQAAKRGYAVAQYNLGVMYAEGTGVHKDSKQAMYWYCKAADRGDENAKSSLASLYANGADAPADRELSYFCWLLGSAKRAPQLVNNERSAMEKTVTPDQLARAQAAAPKWAAQ
jgi:hypothetical protein